MQQKRSSCNKVISKLLIITLLVGLMLPATFVVSSKDATAATAANGVLVKSGFSFIIDMQFIGNDLYFIDFYANAVKKMDTNKTVSTVAAVNRAVSMCVTGGAIYLTTDLDGLKKMNLDGSGLSTFAGVSSGQYRGIGYDSQGNIITSDMSGIVYKITADGSSKTQIASGFTDPIGLAIAPNDDIYIAMRGGSIKKMHSDGTGISTVYNNAVKRVVIYNNYLYAETNNSIVRMNLDGSNIVSLTGGINSSDAWAIATDNQGEVYYALKTAIYKIMGTATTTDATHVVLNWNTDLSGLVASPAAFTLHGIASNPTVTNAVVSGSAITLTLNASIAYEDQPITLDYTKTGMDNLTTSIGEIGNFTNLVVSNSLSAPTPSPTPTPTPTPTLITPISQYYPPANSSRITVDVKEGNTQDTASKIIVERTEDGKGNATDKIRFSKDNAVEAINNLKKSNNDVARIVIPATKENIVKTAINIPVDSIDVLADGGINLKIETENAKIDLSKESLKKVNQNGSSDLFFNFIPIKQEEQKAEQINNAKIGVVQYLGKGTDSKVSAVGVPMTIETNMSSLDADLTLPLTGIDVPTDAAGQKALAKQLGVYIIHSDGQKEFVRGEIVDYQDGVYGIKFHVKKFSIFTVIKTQTVKSKKCNLIKVISPLDVTMTGTDITKTVNNKTKSIKVNVSVSKEAKWKLYSDKACKKVLKNNVMKLKEGSNNAYIKVVAENGESSKIYKITIVRKALFIKSKK